MAQRCTAGTNYASTASNIPNPNGDCTMMWRAAIASSPSGTGATVWRLKVNDGNQDYTIFVDFGFGLALQAVFNTGFSGPTLTAPGLSDGTVYHIATVREGTAVRLYINNVLIDDDTNDASGRASMTLFDICGYGAPHSNVIDVEGGKFFAFAMTQPEIEAAMDESWPTTPDADNLWPFVDGLGADGEDHRGSCDLTITGTLGDSGGDFQEWPPEDGDQTIEATVIASATTFGTAKVNQQIRATAIASATTFGTAKVNQEIRATAIASATTFGAATVSTGQFITATVITSTNSFGTAKVNQQIRATAIASETTFGAAVVSITGNQTIVATIIASATTFGAAVVTDGVTPQMLFGIVRARVPPGPGPRPGPRRGRHPAPDYGVACTGDVAVNLTDNPTFRQLLIAFGNATTGAIFYWDSGLRVLPPGSEGQVLTMGAGGLPEWETP